MRVAFDDEANQPFLAEMIKCMEEYAQQFNQPLKEDNKVEESAVFFGRMVDESKDILKELKLLRVLRHYGFESVEDAVSKVDNLPPLKEDKESVPKDNLTIAFENMVNEMKNVTGLIPGSVFADVIKHYELSNNKYSKWKAWEYAKSVMENYNIAYFCKKCEESKGENCDGSCFNPTPTVLTEEQLEAEIEQLFEWHTDGAVGLTESIKKGVKDFVISKISFPNHVTAEQIWEAAEKRTEYDNDCSCGKCDYCTEVKPNMEIPPDKQTFLSSLNLNK